MTRRYEANANGTVAAAERYCSMYDDRWRVVGVFRDVGSAPKESFVYHAVGNAGRGSSSYIDSVILRDRDANGGGGWTGAADGCITIINEKFLDSLRDSIIDSRNGYLEFELVDAGACP